MDRGSRVEVHVAEEEAGVGGVDLHVERDDRGPLAEHAGGAPAADRGGTNPAQVGLGVKVAATTTNWTQGATQSTGRSTDFMIEGDGFFVTRNGSGEQLFTRAGSFDFDGAGKLVTPDGSILQGWMADAAGTVTLWVSVAREVASMRFT